MMHVGVMPGYMTLFMVTPFISLVGVASYRYDDGFELIFIFIL
jgi:hypothetical protein